MQTESDSSNVSATSFRTRLMAWLSATAPQESSQPEEGLGVLLIELFSQCADELSRFQDQVAQEAYLETAREQLGLREGLDLLRQLNDTSAKLASTLHTLHC